jgi:hypothetical protein
MLMRSKLSPDCTKLIVSTQEGKLIMINNLSLTHLAEDMKEFLPHRFLTQTIHQRDSSLMNRKRRNYFEIINDWPLGNGAGDIASIQVHILKRIDHLQNASIITILTIIILHSQKQYSLYCCRHLHYILHSFYSIFIIYKCNSLSYIQHREVYSMQHYVINLTVTCGRSMVFSGTLVSFTNKTDSHNITEILLKVVLNTVSLMLTPLNK